MRHIFSFLYITPPDLTQVFSKSAAEELSKWQICGLFDCFHSLTIKRATFAKHFTPIILGCDKHNYLFTTLSRFCL